MTSHMLELLKRDIEKYPLLHELEKEAAEYSNDSAEQNAYLSGSLSVSYIRLLTDIHKLVGYLTEQLEPYELREQRDQLRTENEALRDRIADLEAMNDVPSEAEIQDALRFGKEFPS